MEETSGRKSILESKYEDINRPMSQKELRGLYKKYMNQLKISNEMVYHSKSKYFYFVKKYGQKEKELLELKQENTPNYNCDIGNCSVTWKLAKTPSNLRHNAIDIVKSYMYNFEKDRAEKLTHYKVELAKVFYTWLYKEKYN